ncbi:unnamed protein product [[Candida] boidinii]|nr:unnamed protein product [[Candida] boidinii]
MNIISHSYLLGLQDHQDDEEILKIYYETVTEKKGHKFSFFQKKSNGTLPNIKREKKRVPHNERELIEYAWKKRMSEYSHKDYVNQVALYLLIWGEANNLRFMPECLCFIYKCAFDYYVHVQKNGIGLQLDIAEEFDFLNKIITPLYCFIRDQQFIKIEGKYVRNDKDHSKIITYDDINQTFWYKQGLNRIKLDQTTKLLDFPIYIRYKKIHLAPSIFILGVIPLTAVSKTGFIVSIIQFCISILTFVWFTVKPLGNMFEFKKKVKFQLYDPQKTFTASFPSLKNEKFYLSIVMWLFVFLSKSLESKSDGKSLLRTPTFFLNQDDNKSSIDFLDSNSEVHRRILFFAQSLSTPFETPIPIGKLPSFTVLIPHYSESIIIDLKQIIRQDPDSKISLLDYLKELYPQEWKNFVDESKRNSITVCEDKQIYEDELLLISKYLSPFEEDDALKQGIKEFPTRLDNGSSTTSQNDEEFLKSKVDDIPLYCVGYNTSDKSQSLKTRVWVSLRTQTLYRTISGFMNYFTALEILKNIETKNKNKDQNKEEEAKTVIEPDMSEFLDKKLRILLCVQRLETMSEDETEDVKILVQKFPNLYISSLEKTTSSNDPQRVVYYSTLYHGYTFEENYLGEREFQLKRKYRIRLSGNPILGDGKSDNQNHSLIFYRGEYIQVIDANQDNYLEECFKIRSVLAEFEEINNRRSSSTNIYLPSKSYTSIDPVAIVGAREHIFSANTGVLGDVAAGKEQTFGTLFARTLAGIGGKLHYGHPDFLNGIFMTTRGGLSKAQKGLHLNEDIFAGMNALMRGGRIKHCDYYQCGKGRDLGFSSILNFTSKIGGGMGEQLISREYYYLGTQLPTDRFLSFYYAHAGFHLNNLFIIISLHIFMLIIVNLGALNSQTIKCEYSASDQITDRLFNHKGTVS